MAPKTDCALTSAPPKMPSESKAQDITIAILNLLNPVFTAFSGSRETNRLILMIQIIDRYREIFLFY